MTHYYWRAGFKLGKWGVKAIGKFARRRMRMFLLVASYTTWRRLNMRDQNMIQQNEWEWNRGTDGVMARCMLRAWERLVTLQRASRDEPETKGIVQKAWTRHQGNKNEHRARRDGRIIVEPGSECKRTLEFEIQCNTKLRRRRMTRGYSSRGSLRVREIRGECEPSEIEIALRDSRVGTNKANEKDTIKTRRQGRRRGSNRERKKRGAIALGQTCGEGWDRGRKGQVVKAYRATKEKSAGGRNAQQPGTGEEGGTHGREQLTTNGRSMRGFQPQPRPKPKTNGRRLHSKQVDLMIAWTEEPQEQGTFERQRGNNKENSTHQSEAISGPFSSQVVLRLGLALTRLERATLERI
ncbi:hypothetical protein K438DRAFT_2150849 [Mycena galopus ATCC 62051]|nr:hypothetical protein K438DRAFT_2150849 [Mycena galopus ATCC 62051]